MYQRSQPALKVPDDFPFYSNKELETLNIFKRDERGESIVSYSFNGKKINVIKLIREQTGLMLRDSKRLMELNVDTWAKLYL